MNFFYNVEISRILPTVETEISFMWLEFSQKLMTTISNDSCDKLSIPFPYGFLHITS